MIDFSDVTCVYGSSDAANGARDGSITALDHVDLHIDKGSFTCLVGRNGSGKSTAARCMNALQLPASGTVIVDGMDTADGEVTLEIRRRAGMVFQDPDDQLVSPIVEDDVAFGPENLGMPTEEIRRRVDAALETAGISDLRLSSPDRLSGGQKQRVAIAGVLAMEPECIIFDESTAMLDPEGRSSVMDMILKLRSRGTTVILITHFMEEVARADRVIVLMEGRAISDGTPAEIFSRPDLIESAGLDLPEAVKIRDLLRRRGADIPDTVLDIPALADWAANAAGR